MKNLLTIFLTVVLAPSISTATGQVLKDVSREIVVSRDVKVHVAESADHAHQYYYLPTTWELSVVNNRPEIALTLYAAADNSDVKGGLLHVLIQWGLSEAQEKKTLEILRHSDSLAVLAGAAMITLNENNFHIIPGQPIADLLNRSSSMPVKVSTMPGHKTAISFQLSAQDAAALLKVIGEKKDVSAAKFESGYSFSVARQHGAIRTAYPKEGLIIGTFSTWLNALRDFGQIKFVTL